MTLDSAVRILTEAIEAPAHPDNPKIPTFSTFAQLDCLKERLSHLRGELRSLKDRHLKVRMELARTWRIVYRLRKEVERLNALLPASAASPTGAGLTAPRDLAPSEMVIPNVERPAPHADSGVVCEKLPAEMLPKQFLAEFAELAQVPANLRRYSLALRQFSYAFHAVSPHAYRLVRGILPLPSVTTLRIAFVVAKSAVIAALTGGEGSMEGGGLSNGEVLSGFEALNSYLRKYRDSLHLPPVLIPCALAFDAAVVSSTGFSKEPTSAGSCFSFLLLPLDHRLPSLLIRSLRYKNGHIND